MKSDSQRSLTTALMVEELTVQAGVMSTTQQSGYLAMAWRRLRRDRTAMFSGALVIIIILSALLAPLLAPHNPAEQFVKFNPRWATCTSTLFAKII